MSLSFRPDAKLVSCVRSFVSEFCGSVLRDEDIAARVALTIHELLENTLKYSTDGQAALELILDREQDIVKIQTTSRATAEQVDALSRRIDSIRVMGDPMDAYLRVMQKSRWEDQESGLGLIRIKVEGEMDLGYSIDGDRITITAETQIHSVAA